MVLNDHLQQQNVATNLHSVVYGTLINGKYTSSNQERVAHEAEGAIDSEPMRVRRIIVLVKSN